jgi:perosamine synthetase
MMTTNDGEFWQRAKRLRDHAMSQPALFSRGAGVQLPHHQAVAALGVAQLERIDDFLNRRTEIMGRYRQEIPATDRIRLNRVKSWAKSAFWMICLEVESFDAARRDAFIGC